MTKPSHNSSAVQRNRLIEHLLTHGRVTSVYAWEALDCYHPNARILELRRAGYGIKTTFSRELDAFDRPNTAGVRTLTSLPDAANDAQGDDGSDPEAA
jgi:hypothetical protein